MTPHQDRRMTDSPTNRAEEREMRFNGIEVCSNPYVPATRPRMQLSRKVAVSAEFRAKFDSWLREFFGEEACAFLIDPAALGMVGEKLIVMAPGNLAMLRMQP